MGNANQMRELIELEKEYMQHNPGSESPADAMFVLGSEAIIKLLKFAQNKPINIKSRIDHIDDVDIYVDGNLIDLNTIPS